MKPNKVKRIRSWILTIAMVISLVPSAWAFTPPNDLEGENPLANGFSEDPSKYEIYPVPHSVVYPEDAAQIQPTKTIQVVAQQGVDEYTIAFVKEVLERYGYTMVQGNALAADKTNLVLKLYQEGEAAPTVYPDLFTSAEKFDPYTLTVEAAGKGTITITGKDTDCVYFGVATLQMMFSSFAGRYLLPVQIEDYSDVMLRGFIEGFYGGFDYEGRESQMRAIRDVKGNMYVFASKTDPYHGTSWDVLYPKEELDKIAHLVQVGKEHKVEYTWSVHIGKGKVLGEAGKDISDEQYQKNLEKLKAKFQQLYDIGVRSFQILNDDYNSGTYARQVQLLNEMNQWLKDKGDCMPLIYCPAGYNTAWAQAGTGGQGKELVALQDMDKDIYLYWTGADVNSPIKQDNINWPIEKSKHYPVTWLNYPCSEHGKSGIYLGDISHYVSQADGLEHQMGIISNPVDYPEANKVAYFQLISWGWNRDEYTSYLTELWEDSFKYLQPEVYDSYLTIARNVSNCPGSGRIPQGFPESEYLKTQLESVQAKILSDAPLKNDPEVQALLKELEHILWAVEDFRANCANEALIAELSPWLSSLKGIAQAGKGGIEAAIALQDNNLEGAWAGLSAASIGLDEWDNYMTPNYPDVIAKGGSKRLQPFASKVIDFVSQRVGDMLNPGGMEGDPTFIGQLGGTKVAPSANTDKMFDGKDNTYASFDSGFVQQQGDYYGIDLGSVQTVTNIRILQGADGNDNNYFHKAVVQCSTNGTDWVDLTGRVNSQEIQVSDLSVQARYVRLYLEEIGYGPKLDFWTRVREFTVTTTKSSGGLYTNMAQTEGASIQEDGGSYTLSFGESLTFQPGQYIGLDLGEVTGVREIIPPASLPDGLAVEYSSSSVSWTGGSLSQDTPVRYVRIINTGTQDVTAKLNDLTVTAIPKLAPSLLKTNVNDLNHGTWVNAFDGDVQTYVQTKKNQAPGQYFIFDLGGQFPIHDLKLYTHENNDYIYYMDISISNDANGTWTKIATVDNDTKMEPPYRTFACDGNGQEARYLKLEVTKAPSKGQWLIINEIVINKTQEQEQLGAFSGSPVGKFENTMDGSLSTVLSLDTITQPGSYFQYLISEDNRISEVKILQDASAICHAEVEVQTADNAWHTLGSLDRAVSTFSTADFGDLTALRLNWQEGTTPTIAEIILVGNQGEQVEQDFPLALPSIYETREVPENQRNIEVNYGTPEELLGLPVQGDVVLSNGQSYTLPLMWTCEKNYQADQEGRYSFVGRYDLSGLNLTNPGNFTQTATVKVRPEASSQEVQLLARAEENLALKQPVYVSGVEVKGQTTPAEAVDGNPNTRWSGNYMKNKVNSDSWIVVDLGEDVDSITSISTKYYNKVWPTDFLIQVAGEDFIPKDFSDINERIVTAPDTFTGQNAKGADCWTTLCAASNYTVGDNGTYTISSDTFAVPEGTRYLRVYYEKMNPNASGDAIGLRELEVMGTRTAPEKNTEVQDTIPVKAQVSGQVTQQNLPRYVVANLKDGSAVKLPVQWDLSDLPQGAETVTVKGTLQVSGEIKNPDQVQATLTLTITPEPQITSWKLNPSTLTVPVGTEFSKLLLPKQGAAQLDNGLAEVYDITWNKDGYNKDEPGSYQIFGTYALAPDTLSEEVPLFIQVQVVGQGTSYVTVTFDSQGGSSVPAQTVPAGTPVVKPADPTRSGYEFMGWYVDAAYTQAWDFTKPVEQSMTLYAKWRKTGGGGSSGSGSQKPTEKPDPIENLTDVSQNDWFAPAVSYVLDKGLMTGVGEGQFAPYATTDRAMIVTILYQMAGRPGVQGGDSFPDVPDGQWYADAAAWASQEGIVSGYQSGAFGPNDPVTREQLALILYQFAKQQGDTTKPNPVVLKDYADVEQLSPWAVEAMSWAVQVGLISGKDGKQLDPAGQTIRAETAQMLMNFDSKILG